MTTSRTGDARAGMSLWKLSSLDLIVYALVLGLCLGVDQTRLLEDLEHSVERLLPVKPRSELVEVPLTLLAVDQEYTSVHGCPPYSGTQLLQLEERLAALGLRELVLPDGAAPWLAPSVVQTPGALRYLVPWVETTDPYYGRSLLLAPPEGARVEALPALSMVRLDHHGQAVIVPRQHRGERQTFESWLADRMGKRSRAPLEGEYVQFTGRSKSLPTFPLSRLVGQEFSAAELAGKTVLLATIAPGCRELVQVPSELGEMSRAEYHAQASLTLLGPAKRRLPWYVRAILILGLILLSGFLQQRVRIALRLMPIFLALGWILLTVGSWYLIGVFLPLGAAFLGLVLVTIHAEKTQTLDLLEEMRQVTTRLGQRIEAWVYRYYSGGDLSLSSHLEHVLAQAAHHAPVEQVLLFVLPRTRFHLRFLAASGGGDEHQVQERRRDIRRRPWSNVITNAVGEDMGTFLRDGSRSYGVPILDFGRLLGVLVYRLEQGEPLEQRKRSVLERLGNHLAPLILETPETVHPGFFARLLLRLSQNDLILRELTRGHVVSRQVVAQLDKYREILGNIDSGIIYADLTGRILYQNSFAAVFLEKLGLAGADNCRTVLEPLCKHNGCSVDLMFETLLSGDRLHPLAWQNESGSLVFQILVGVMRQQFGGEEEEMADQRPSAMMLVIKDVTRIHHVDRLKGHVLHLSSYKAKNLITGLLGYLDLIEPGKTEPFELEVYVDHLGTQIRQLDAVLSGFSDLAEQLKALSSDGAEALFDFIATVRECLTEQQETAKARGVTLDLASPPLGSPVIGNYLVFKEGLGLLLRDILRSCYQGQRLVVQLQENEKSMSLVLEDPSLDPSEELLRAIRTKAWNELSESLGKGLRMLDEAGFEVLARRGEQHGLFLHLQVAKV